MAGAGPGGGGARGGPAPSPRGAPGGGRETHPPNPPPAGGKNNPPRGEEPPPPPPNRRGRKTAPPPVGRTRPAAACPAPSCVAAPPRYDPSSCSVTSCDVLRKLAVRRTCSLPLTTCALRPLIWSATARSV